MRNMGDLYQIKVGALVLTICVVTMKIHLLLFAVQKVHFEREHRVSRFVPKYGGKSAGWPEIN